MKSYKGLIGATLFPFLAYSLYATIKNYEPVVMEETVEEAKHTTFAVPYYNNGLHQGSYQKQVHLGKRIIRRVGGIRQTGADCGYHALYNAMCLYKNSEYALGDKARFNSLLDGWKKQVVVMRSAKHTSNISSGEIEALMKKQKKNLSLIDNVDWADSQVQEKIDAHLSDNVERFQKKRTSQVVILNTSTGNVYANFGGSWHWLAVKLEWADKETVRMTVVDSVNGKNDAILDRLYNLFVGDMMRVEMVGG